MAFDWYYLLLVHEITQKSKISKLYYLKVIELVEL